MVVSIAVVNVGVETMLVGMIFYGSRVASWFLDGIFSGNVLACVLIKTLLI